MRATVFSLLACSVLAACSNSASQKQAAEVQTQATLANRNAQYDIPQDLIFDLFRLNSQPNLGVNVDKVLWQASLETLSFLPLEAVDPFSGLIITGWGQVAGDPAPVRVTVYISGPELDARALKVAAFRQAGGRAVPVTEDQNRQLENAILTRARQIRMAGSSNS